MVLNFVVATLFSTAVQAAGKCNAEDMTKAADLAKYIPACMQESQTATGITACIEKDGFSAPCAGCVGTYGQCVIDNCMSDCADPQSASCKTCYTDKCMPAFLSCTGFPSPKDLEQAQTAKCDAQDNSKARELQFMVPHCLQQNEREGEQVPTLTACFARDFQFSSSCAFCLGTYGSCIYTKCKQECFDENPNGTPCKNCWQNACEPAMLTCTGFPADSQPNLLAALAQPEAGKCNAEDMTKAAGLAKDIPACMQESQTASGIAACIEKDGFSAGCSGCVGTYGKCVLDNCMSDCADPTSATCKTCYNSKCMPAFLSCTGFPAPKEELKQAEAGKCDANDMSLAAGLAKDIPTCMKESQTASGIAACIEKDGFSAPCAGCVGTYGQCVLDNCMSDCADPTSSTCKTCYESKCMPAFLTCTGFPAPKHELTQALAGKCDQNDQGKAFFLRFNVPQCLQQHENTGEQVPDLTACFARDFQFSSSCAYCLGVYGNCIYTKCKQPCFDGNPQGTECKNCWQNACEPAMLTCTGFPANSQPNMLDALRAPEAGKCNAEDMTKAAGLAKDIPACMQESQTASGIAACIEKDGFSAGCSGCVGTYGQCVLDNCMSDCADPTSASCKTCYTDKCMPAFLSCTGFPSPKELEQAQAGKCDANDMSLAAKLQTDIPACMKKSQTASGIAACIEKDGFSAGCSGCVGTYGKCVLDNCMSDCADPTSATCKTCYTSKCMPAFLTCTGFPKPRELGQIEAGKCTDSADMALALELAKDIPDCMKESQTASGIATCIQNHGFTAACAGCVGTYGQCVIDKCMSDCADPTSASCKTCYTDKCMPAFLTCSGFPKPSLELAPTPLHQDRLVIRMLRAE